MQRLSCAWQWVVISAALPLIALGVGLHILAVVHFCNDSRDVIHFLIKRPSYIEKIRATPSNGEPRLLVFNRGGMIWSSRGVVYDESDEVLRDPSLQSPRWKARAQNCELSCGGVFVKPFPGHFALTKHWYLASFPC
jgi:hypothetical protein